MEEDALTQMHRMVQPSINFNRSKFSELFVSAFSLHQSKAIVVYVKGMELILKQRTSAIDEVFLVYSHINGSKLSRKDVPITSLLKIELPQRYRKIQYLLRVYIMRSILLEDSAVIIPVDQLYKVAGKEDIGRIAVIDFVLTREKVTKDYMECLKFMYESLENPSSLKKHEKRHNATLKLIQTLKNMQPGIETLSDIQISMSNSISQTRSPSVTQYRSSMPSSCLNGIIHCTDIVKQIELFATATDDDIISWLDLMTTVVGSNSEQKNIKLSHALTNLGAHLKNRKIIVPIWQLAAKIEIESSKPSPFVVNKLKKFLLVVPHYPESDFSILGSLFTTCVKFTSEMSPRGQLSDKELSMYKDITLSFIAWKELTNALKSEDCGENIIVHSAQLLVFMAGSIKELPESNETLDKLMKLSLNKDFASLNLQVELHQSYYAIVGKCYDRDLIKNIAYQMEWSKEKCIALCMLAKSSDSLAESYKHCSELLNLKNSSSLMDIISTTLNELAFTDIADSLKVDISFSCSILTMSEITRPKTFNSPMEELRQAESNFISLQNLGCYKAALRYLKRAAFISRGLSSSPGIRILAYAQVVDDMRRKLNIKRDIVKECIDLDFDSSLVYDAHIQKSIDWYKSQITPPTNRQVVDFNEKYDCTLRELRDSKYNNLLTKPLFLSSYNNNSSTITNEQSLEDHRPNDYDNDGKKDIARKILNTINSTNSITNVSWFDKRDIAHKLQHLHILAAYLTAETIPKGSITLESYKNDLIDNNRSLYSPQTETKNTSYDEFKCPPGTVCVCLDVNDDAITLTRHEPDNTPMVIRFPIKLGPFEALEKLQSIIEKGFQFEDYIDDANKYWSHHLEVEGEMSLFLKQLEEEWIGDYDVFVNTMHSITEESKGNVALKEQLEPLLSAVEIELINLHAANGNMRAVNAMCRSAGVENIRLDVDKNISHASKPIYNHLILICDRTASQIPWESMQFLKDVSVTRAVSLRQVTEWIFSDKVSLECPRYIVNPDDNLPSTELQFEKELKRLGAKGLTGRVQKDEVLNQLKESTIFIYIGHGAGRKYLPSTIIRRSFKLRASVLLFGCNSLEVENCFYDNDTVTDYAVAGANCYLGTLWAVRDKDENRFTKELLKLIFQNRSMSQAMKMAKKACALAYLTSGAQVVYGLK